MSEMESSPIVILSEDDDDDDDIVVVKEEKAPIPSNDSIDDDEVIFIAQSTPTTSLTSKGRNSSIGSCKTEPAANKDLARSLSITTAFDLSLTLTGPLDLSKPPHRDGDLVGAQNASPTAGSKVADAETNLANMEEADSQDITDDILGSVGSSLDSSLIGGPGSPSACSDISDNSQSSCPHASSSDWSMKWGAPVPALTASPRSSILGSVSSSSGSSTLGEDDDLWELFKPVTDIQGCAAKVANLVDNSPVPANIQYNVCDTTKSSSTSGLSGGSTNRAAACNSNSAPSTPVTPTSKSLLHRFYSSQSMVPGTSPGVLSDLNITVTSSLFPSAVDVDDATVAKVKLSPKPLCATDAKAKPLLSVPKVEPPCVPSTSYSAGSQAADFCSGRTNAEPSSDGTHSSVFPNSRLDPVQVVSRSSYTTVSGSSVVFISASGSVPVSSSGICSSVSTSRMGSGSVFSFGTDCGLTTISSSASSSSSSPTTGTCSRLTSAPGTGFGSGSTSPPGFGCRLASVPAANSGATRSSSTSKLSQNSLPLRKRVHPDPKDLVSPPPVSCKNEDSCVNCKCVLLGLKVSRCTQAHPVCGLCLEDQVKLILTDKQGSLKCILITCDSYYPISELKHTLPAMVVEILEDKLHKDYINFVADMIMPDSGDASNQPGTSTTRSKGDGSDSPKKPKFDDILDQFEPLKDLAGKPAKSPAEEIPLTWDTIDKMFPQNQVIVTLEPESEEYVGIAVKFHHTLTFPSADIVKISRVQNPILWKYYQLKRTEMIRDNDGHAVEERQLFHGTSGTVVEAICRKGFDWRVCGKHGCMYGQGSYFAKAASYSHQYTDRPSSGVLYQPGSVRPSSGLMHLNLNLSRLANCLKVINQHQPPPPAHVNIYSGQLPGLPLSQLKPQASQSQSTALHNTNLPAPAAKTLPANNHTAVLPSTSSAVAAASSTQQSQQQQGKIPPWAGPLLPSSSTSTASGNWNYPNVTMGSSLSAFAIANKNATWYSQYPPSQQAAAAAASTEASSSSAAASSSVASSTSSAVPPVHKATKDAKSRVISVMDIAASTNRKMFLAKVLVGKYTGGTNSHRKPPPFFPHEPYGKCYDSCVDNIWDPKIFVIFDSNQAYPEYIVEYNVVSD